MGFLDLAKRELRKHVATVHTLGKLTLLERKVANILLLNAYNDLPTKSRYRIRVRDLAILAGFDSKDVALLQDSILSLMSIIIQWNALHDGEDDWEASTFLSYARIRKGVCTYGYTPELREKLYDPTIYARINLSVQREFRSSYALALYENCLRFRKTGSTGWIDLETWRGLLGVRNGTYPAYKEFRRRVLVPAIKEVNEHSDIKVKLEPPRRERRKIAALKFTISDNAQLSLGLSKRAPLQLEPPSSTDDEGRTESPLLRRLAEFGLEDQALDIVQKYDSDRINGNLDIVRTRIDEGKKIKSVAALARDAIEKDYRPKKTKVEEEAEQKKKDKRQRRQQAKAKRELDEKRQREREREETRRIHAQIAALPDDLQEELERRAAAKFRSFRGQDKLKAYQEAKDRGEASPIDEALMRGYRTHVYESKEFKALVSR